MFVCFSSEDEGFRFSIGKPLKSLKEARNYIESKYIPSLGYIHVEGETYRAHGDTYKFPYRPVSQLTEKQIENSCEPDCHGKLVAMYALDQVDGDIWKKLNTENGYAYDWVFIYQL